MLSYKGANQISLISTLKNLPKTIPAAYNDFYAFFFSSSTIVKNPISVKICYGVVFSLFLLSTLKILFSQKAPWLWIILLICLLPMACNILNLAAPETTIILRTACGMVVAFPAIFLITIKNLGEKKCKLSFSAVSRGLCLCACAVLAWTQIIICNMDSMYMKTNRDVILSCSQNMFAQLQNREDVQNGAPVAIIGTPTSWMSDSTLKENVNTYAKDALVWSSADGMWNGWFRINQRYIGAKWIRWCDFDTYTSLIATAVNVLLNMHEKNAFFRALSSWVGFKSIQIEYDVREREIGESKWSTKSLIKYALTNITSFTTFPMQIVTFLGCIMLVVTAIIAIVALIQKIRGLALSGFTTVIILQCFTGSVVMLSLGIIGFYISKIYEEVQGRPKYIISERKN